ncbi:MAG: glycoside hydrolase 43 family protein [Gracilimonas sp.]
MCRLLVFCLSGMIISYLGTGKSHAQQQGVSNVWVADNGDGTYTNPILHADYSDPDVIRVGEDFYMTSSSFNTSPGLPILHSKDLVNWKLINHALPKIIPEEHFRTPQHGNGVWAPSFRYHEGKFYIYWGDPDFGIYMVKTDDPRGEWEDPVLVKGGKGLIDSSPLWDDDGRAYLVHAYARSRSGINSVLVVQEMNKEGTTVKGDPVLVFDGHEGNRVVEGPKFLKRGDWYYIMAPAGGVAKGWQLALRSKNVFGPYEAKRVLQQGNTNINGPHQGGLVDLESGESWFVHFQEKQPYGRIVHLNPVRWENGWPMMGEDQNNDGVGEPVKTYQKPDVSSSNTPIVTPVESDEFNSDVLGLQWQWHGNPESTWAMTSNFGFLRLYGKPAPEGARNLWDVPNLLLQKFPAPEFTATTKMEFTPHMIEEKAGLIAMGEDYSYVAIKRAKDGFQIIQVLATGADAGEKEHVQETINVDQNEVWFRAEVQAGGLTSFSFSTDGKKFKNIGEKFQAKEGRWIGAKIGVFATQPRNGDKEDYLEYSSQHSGFADVDWFRITQLEK